MASPVTVSNEDITAALSASERFPVDSPQFEAVAPFIGHLVEIVGEDHLGDIVEVGTLCSVTARYIDWLAANDAFLSKLDDLEAEFVKELYGHLADHLKAMGDDPESMLAPHGLTSETFLLSNELGLSEAAKKLVYSGELTFAKLLTTSPAIFIPASN